MYIKPLESRKIYTIYQIPILYICGGSIVANSSHPFFIFGKEKKVQHSWWYSIGRTGQHHSRCPGDGIRCRWQGNGPRSRTRSMMTSPANNAATSSIREGHTKLNQTIKVYKKNFLQEFRILFNFH
uniref:Uncharacterized protein n=1 Tax=Schizaphis graminum TaxID=13262 RepID=A0A2S2N9R9_SCHGA